MLAKMYSTLPSESSSILAGRGNQDKSDGGTSYLVIVALNVYLQYMRAALPTSLALPPTPIVTIWHYINNVYSGRADGLRKRCRA
jgi:hypothetical protein